jgi:2,3-diketo-5-methylthio-1-phosphopentane phosphatase
MNQHRLFLLDVEGTVAPLSLTSEQLFPYARARFEAFLRKGIAEIESRQGELVAADLGADSLFHDLALLQAENHAETDPEAPRIQPHRSFSAERASENPSDAVPDMLAYIYWLMDRDRKSTALKSLQGKIWKAGFESGEIKGTLFDDVPRAFARWSAYAKIAIYSSGSTAAQQLLFRHSIFGDLTSFIAAYFDTRIGPKTEHASYVGISAAMEVAPNMVCFFSDVLRELDPARAAGMDTRLVVRPGNASIESNVHQCIHSLDEIP